MESIWFFKNQQNRSWHFRAIDFCDLRLLRQSDSRQFWQSYSQYSRAAFRQISAKSRQALASSDFSKFQRYKLHPVSSRSRSRHFIETRHEINALVCNSCCWRELLWAGLGGSEIGAWQWLGQTALGNCMTFYKSCRFKKRGQRGLELRLQSKWFA